MRILVAAEKHADVYYDATTSVQLRKSALRILTDRFEMGEYLSPDDMYEWEDKTYGPYLAQDIDAIIDPTLREEFIKNKKLAQTNKLLKAQYKTWYDEVESAVRNKNDERAFQLLLYRNDYEYEAVSVEDVLVP